MRPRAQLRWDLPYYLWHGARTACCVLSDERYASAAYQRSARLARYLRRAMPEECQACSYFAGYP